MGGVLFVVCHGEGRWCEVKKRNKQGFALCLVVENRGEKRERGRRCGKAKAFRWCYVRYNTLLLFMTASRVLPMSDVYAQQRASIVFTTTRTYYGELRQDNHKQTRYTHHKQANSLNKQADPEDGKNRVLSFFVSPSGVWACRLSLLPASCRLQIDRSLARPPTKLVFPERR